MITGDLMHHPCQIARPDWKTPFDSDGEQAQATRKAFLERYADRPVLVLGTHFADPVGGRIVRDGQTYRFEAWASDPSSGKKLIESNPAAS